jgi:hypothetical protein
MSDLARSDPAPAGIGRRRCGRGFRYLGSDGTAVRDPGTITRLAFRGKVPDRVRTAGRRTPARFLASYFSTSQ